MTEVSIIELELSEEIPAIIDSALTAISEQNQEQIRSFQEIAAAKERVKESRQLIKQTATAAVATRLAAAQEALVKAGDDGVGGEQLMQLVTPLIRTSSALTLRLKALLKQEGNKWELVKRKDRYYLKPYNQ